MRLGQILFVLTLLALIAIGLGIVALFFGSLEMHYAFTHGPGCPDPTYPY